MSLGRTEKWPLRILFLLILVEAGFFFFYGISRHANYLTSINDLGCFDQAVWGLINDAPFLNTILLSQPINWVGFHFHPILILFVPFYLIAPSATWFVFAQAVALPLTALPIYFLVLHVTNSKRLAFVWSLICLLSPFMLSAASWDFHPVSLAVPFIALGYLALERKCFGLLFFCCIMILLCKEHFGLLVIGFGILLAMRHRRFGSSLLLLTLGVLHFILVFKVVMPHLSPLGGHLMLAEGHGHLSRYSWLGHSFGDDYDLPA